MGFWNSIVRFFAVPDDPELVQAQARALTRQVPLMYILLLTNTLILATTHTSAPDVLRFYVPLALAAFCLARLQMWWRGRTRVLSHVQARRLLRSTVYVAALLGIGFSTWALSLFPYGDPYQQSHIAFYMSLTSVCCLFSLMHLRGAAAMAALCVLAPFGVFFLSSGNLVFSALALNLLIVTGGLIFILNGHYRDFGALVASQGETAHRQTETQRLSDENQQLANVDSLTTLPNRRAFDRQLRELLADAERTGRQIAVARMDLDSFKAINEIFGQNTGDQVLVEVANRVVKMKRPDSVIARLSADNFALIIPSPHTHEELIQCGARLSGAMLRAFELPDATIHLSATVGLSASRPGDTPATLFDRADYATSVAKREARGQALVFSDQHQRDISKVRAMEHALRTADLDEEIYILFQPQFDIGLNRTTGYEVLARWRSPLLGEVSPGEFIPLAERTGTISKITQAVLRKALAFSEQLPRPLRLSVNLSAQDLASTTAIEGIAALVGQFGTPCRIDFEITETAVMRDLDQANQALLVLLSLGARIALDDFGTGHSSLTHVQKLPLDRIKIDRSFVVDVTTDTTSRAIVKTMIDLCRNLGISCVFEGIETEQQLDVLLGLGGTIMQGYLFGRPMSADAVLDHCRLELKSQRAKYANWD